jgi:hypothetical protein
MLVSYFSCYFNLTNFFVKMPFFVKKKKIKKKEEEKKMFLLYLNENIKDLLLKESHKLEAKKGPSLFPRNLKGKLKEYFF